MHFSTCLEISLVWLFFAFVTVATAQIAQDKVDITKIPMFPQNYEHEIYAGFLNITNYGKSLYYMFFLSQSSDPTNDPVVLWMNGGPGCSSLIGMTTEHGPFLFKSGTIEMYMNQYSWNKRANMIYLQAPAGVGFGFISKAQNNMNDTQTAIDNLVGLQKFFEKFPDYEGNDFYLAGQSYAGVYVPMLAKQIIQFNSGSQNMKINLKGFILGNPCTHPFQCKTATYQSRFFTQILYTHGFIEQELHNLYLSECIANEMSKKCIQIQKNVYQVFLDQGANIYNLFGTCYYPKYPSQFEDLAGQQAMRSFEEKLERNLKHPLRCSDALGSLTLFNRNQHRQGLHVDQLNDTRPWTPCSDVFFLITQSLNYLIDEGAVFNILPSLVKSGLKVFYYSGDQDAIVSIEGTLYWLEQYRKQFGTPIKKSWRPWITANQNISGMVWQLEGITFASVIGAGHMVPTDKPAEALQIFHIFLGYSDWKTPDYYEQ